MKVKNLPSLWKSVFRLASSARRPQRTRIHTVQRSLSRRWVKAEAPRCLLPRLGLPCSGFHAFRMDGECLSCGSIFLQFCSLFRIGKSSTPRTFEKSDHLPYQKSNSGLKHVRITQGFSKMSSSYSPGLPFLGSCLCF